MRSNNLVDLVEGLDHVSVSYVIPIVTSTKQDVFLDVSHSHKFDSPRFPYLPLDLVLLMIREERHVFREHTISWSSLKGWITFQYTIGSRLKLSAHVEKR